MFRDLLANFLYKGVKSEIKTAQKSSLLECLISYVTQIVESQPSWSEAKTGNEQKKCMKKISLKNVIYFGIFE